MLVKLSSLVDIGSNIQIDNLDDDVIILSRSSKYISGLAAISIVPGVELESVSCRIVSLMSAILLSKKLMKSLLMGVIEMRSSIELRIRGRKK